MTFLNKFLQCYLKNICNFSSRRCIKPQLKSLALGFHALATRTLGMSPLKHPLSGMLQWVTVRYELCKCVFLGLRTNISVSVLLDCIFFRVVDYNLLCFTPRGRGCENMFVVLQQGSRHPFTLEQSLTPRA